MAAVTLLGSTNFTTTAGAKTVTATPAARDLIVIMVQVSSDSSWSNPTDDNSDGNGTYTQIGNQLLSGTDRYGAIYVRDYLVSSATSTIFTLSNPGTDAGGGLAVIKITGMSRAGLGSVRQYSQNSGAGGTIANTGTWGSNKLTGNPVIAGLIKDGNAGASSITNYTSLFNSAYLTPGTTTQCFARNSGDTSNTLTLSGSTAYNWAMIGVELDSRGFAPNKIYFLNQSIHRSNSY